MDRSRLICGLRISWSLLWGILCVLLVVLWVRSFRYIDTAICYRGGNWFGIQSVPGHLTATYMARVGLGDGSFFRIGEPIDDQYDHLIFHWTGSFRSALTAHCAHWLAAIPFAVIALIPWIKWRFRLRTLLIATTLIALVLGLISAFER